MDEEKNLNEAAEEVKDAAENVVNEAADTAADATEDAANAVSDAADTVEDAVENAADEAADAVEDAAEAVTDAAEDAAEAAGDTVEDVANTVSEAAEETADMVDEAAGDAAEIVDGAAQELENAVPQKESGASKAVIIAVCALITAAIVVLAVIFVPKILNKSAFNKYNQYVDTTGRTVGEIAEMSGMELSEFLESYSLPADMPADTNESSAFNMIPIGKVLEMYQYENMATVDEAKSFLALPDWIDENTPWGEAVGEAPLKNYIGEENLDAFLEHYGLKDIANGDTLFKEIRQTVDEADKKEREDYEKQIEEMQKQMEEQQAQSDDQTQTEAPADDQAQTEQTADAQTEQTDAANTDAQPAQ